MKNTKILVTLILIIGLTTHLFAGDKSSKEIRGDKYFFVYSFDKAITAYNNSNDLTLEGHRRLAESYQNINMNAEAEIEYLKLLNSTGGDKPNDYFNLVMVLKANGKSSEAKTWMDKFQTRYPTDLRAIDYEKNKSKMSKISADDGKYKILHLDINSQSEDFSPTNYKNSIVFTSSRSNKLFPKDYNYNDQPFLDMYISEKDGKQLKNPSVFDKSLNGKMHDGPASFNKEGTFIAFTKNNYETKRNDKIIELQIFFSHFKDGKWSKEEPFILNNVDYSVGHPSLSADGNTMYFASDMPGGFGGADIYRIKKDANGVWGKAENLGNKVNTESDELFPFYEENNDILFFSSNGRLGLGGLDIFIVTIDGSQTSESHNAGAPLNTISDDFGLLLDANLKSGYFSSDRTGGSGDDDIYSLDVLKDLGIGKKVKGIAKNSTGDIIPETFITLRDADTKTLNTMLTGENGEYIFFIDSDKKFTIEGEKNPYENGKVSFDSYDTNYLIIADVTLLKKSEETILVAVEDEVLAPGMDLSKIINIEVLYFDYDKWNIRPDAKIELNKIVKLMNENPKLIIELSSYADCRNTLAYNQILSDKRANSSVAYIQKLISNPSRISGKGYSESNLVTDCPCSKDVVSTCTEEEHQKNRRTEFIVVSN